MQDPLYGGRRFRTLNVRDEGNREGLASEVAIPAPRVVRVLDQLVALYGCPQALRLDNGPELTAQVFVDWCDRHGIVRLYIQPGPCRMPSSNGSTGPPARRSSTPICSHPRRTCRRSPMRGSSRTTSTDPTTRWVGYRRSPTWRASHRDVSPENDDRLELQYGGALGVPRAERMGPMKRSKFSEEQVAYVLRQAESGTAVGDVCRQVGISEATFYAWKKKYAHLGVSELRRLRQIEEENTRLKRLVADLSLDKHMLSEALRKKSDARTAPRTGWLVSSD